MGEEKKLNLSDLKSLLPRPVKRVLRNLVDKTKATLLLLFFDEEASAIGSEFRSLCRHWSDTWYKTIYYVQPLGNLKPISARYGGPDAPGYAIHWSSAVQIAGLSKPALFAHAPSSVVYRIAAPRAARLRVFVSLLPDAWGGNQGGVEFSVELASSGAAPRVIARKAIHPTRVRRHRRWVEMNMVLKRSTENEFEVAFKTSVPGEGLASRAWAVWGEPVLLHRKPAREILSTLKDLAVLHGVTGLMVRTFKLTESVAKPSETKSSRVAARVDRVGRIVRNESVTHAPCRNFAIYSNSKGNYFFNEIRDLLAAGLKEIGFDVAIKNERQAFASDADWHIVVAPHEFFYLGAGLRFGEQSLPPNLILLNTEQPSTQWFARAWPFFARAHAVWDINHFSAEHIKTMGVPCSYLPLGYVPGFQPFQELKEMPVHYGTCFLEPEILQKSFLHQPIANRPIDVLFLGHLSPKRERFFAQIAPVTSKYRCYFYFWNPQTPIVANENTYMSTATSVGLAQRSKVVLNVHHGQDAYFEWHRVVMHGIWQKALVISEPSEASPPFEAGRDFVSASEAEIGEQIDHYLSSESGLVQAQEIVERGFGTLLSCRLRDILRDLIVHLDGRESKIKLGELATADDIDEEEAVPV